jgi:hypothetical protein
MLTQVFVSVDKDNNPLLNNVGIQRILLVVHQGLDYLLEMLQACLPVLVLNTDQSLEQQKELPVTFGLEFFEPQKDKAERLGEVYATVSRDETHHPDEFLQLERVLDLLQYFVVLRLVQQQVTDFRFRQVGRELQQRLFRPQNDVVNQSPDVTVLVVKFQPLSLITTTLYGYLIAYFTVSLRQSLQFLHEYLRLFLQHVLQQSPHDIVLDQIVQSHCTPRRNLMQNDTVLQRVLIFSHNLVENQIAELALAVSVAGGVEPNEPVRESLLDLPVVVAAEKLVSNSPLTEETHHPLN